MKNAFGTREASAGYSGEGKAKESVVTSTEEGRVCEPWQL